MGAFVSESSLIAYPIVGRIANFLEQDSLLLSKDQRNTRTTRDPESDSIQRSVKQWYDDFGWQRNQSGLYNDTAMFSQVSPTAHGIYALASHLSLVERLSGGDFVLDAASGAIAHPENLAYSWFYRYRVCVDISLTALREAQAKLSGRGFCCLADISQLPFREGVFQGIVSAYTIQHIAESQQSKAVAELYRVLKPGGHLCIVSDVQRKWAHRSLILTVRVFRKIFKLLFVRRARANLQISSVSDPPTPPHKLYFISRDIRWWRNLARSLTDSYTIEAFRIFRKDEFEMLFGESMRAAQIVHALETLFPRLAARMCSYVIVDLFEEN